MPPLSKEMGREEEEKKSVKAQRKGSKEDSHQMTFSLSEMNDKALHAKQA